MFLVPEDYIIQKFFQFCGAPKHNRYNKTYQGSCPICREGNSWLKKKRCYYIPKNNNIFCHNCGWSSAPLSWIQQVSRLSFLEIQKEIKDFQPTILLQQTESRVLKPVDTLPHDSINLSDNTQLEFYKDNPIINNALLYIKSRRLDTAHNRPSKLLISLTDILHKNRIIIPFFDYDGKIVHYQTRSFLTNNDHKAKYISKLNSEKTLFNYDKVSFANPNLFIFEGPFNACFCDNGVAVAGIQESSRKKFTPKQLEQIQELPDMKHIWVLDSQWIDKAALGKSKLLASQGEKVFIWPEKIGKKIKDFNDLAIKLKVDKIPNSFILENTFEGMAAEIRLHAI